MTTKNIALVNGVIFNGQSLVNNQALLLADEKVCGIVALSDIPAGYVKQDVEGAYISPGLIDLQIYGTGDDLFSADIHRSAIGRIEQNLLAQGCTSFMLALATNTLEVFEQAVQVFANANPKVALGLHLEGPFLNIHKRGAHPGELIVEGTIDRIKRLLRGGGEVVKMMTVAPELMHIESIRYLLEHDVVLSAGHSAASFKQAMLGFDQGITTSTHLWNAMSPFHHRDTGLPGAIFSHPSARASIIVDGIHVDYTAVRLSKKLLGDRLFLISDAVARCDKGIYQHVFKDDHYVLPDGTLSGSALSLLQAVANCVNHAGISLDEALRMATVYPADVIGRTDIGNFNSGSWANVVVFDHDFRINSVYFQGERVV
ncbi:MAG: N-acetylglucosamine-6-phosphate deacetylase [Sphingobacterium sp.]